MNIQRQIHNNMKDGIQVRNIVDTINNQQDIACHLQKPHPQALLPAWNSKEWYLEDYKLSTYFPVD